MLPDLFEGCLHVDPVVQTADVLVQPPQPVPTCKGVILFADAEDRCVSMLTAANIRRTAAGRLFGARTDEPDKRTNIAPVVGAIYYQCCYNDFATALKYLDVARILWPDTWESRMSLPKPWFVRIDLTAEWPNFSVTDKPAGSEGRKVFGPFPMRRAASRYVTALRMAFALCHRPDLVGSPKKAAACPDLQMGTCPAPCVGNIGRSEYRRQLEKAVAAAGGRLDGLVKQMRRQMMEFAVDRQFEQASLLKRRIDAVDMLAEKDYTWTHDLSDLAILHIDRWARVAPPDGGKWKVQSYAGYLIVDGQIHCLGPFTADGISEFLHAAADVLQPSRGNNLSDATRDNLAIAAYFLYRKAPPGIWIDCSDNGAGYDMPGPDDIATLIRRTFGQQEPLGDKDQAGADTD
jgi:hypothetical protein